ncbi:MAG: Zn-ribbon domain-containing OB-fold protein [Actinomycetota bacterium]
MSLRPVPEPDVSSVPFWEACARHALVLQTCASCGTVRHPPRPMCPACNSMESTFEQASGRGRIWSWVVAHAPVLPSFADRVPYNVVVVVLEEGVRMVGNLLDVDNAGIEEGMAVTVDFEDVEDGVSLPVWRRA